LAAAFSVTVKCNQGITNLRLTIAQYAGDYREAFYRLARGGKETYHAQQYSVNFVGSLAARIDQVSVVCALSDEKYDVVLENGVRAIGMGLRQGFHASELVPELIKTRPTRLSLMTPMVPVLKWANANRIRTIAILADSFRKEGLRQAFRNHRLAYYLNRPIVDWVGNHGINACLSLIDIGVAADKIVPWDWPASRRPSDSTARSLGDGKPRKLIYVGSVIRAKGVADLLQAIAQLRLGNSKVTLYVVGHDFEGEMKALAHSLDVSDIVHFLGVVPNEDIFEKMRTADIVVIPSRHEYPEGLPLTIYEALCARTPIVASDHPMFRGVLVNGESAVLFPAGNVNELAASIDRLLRNPILYKELSIRSEAVWNDIQLPVTLGKLLEAWIADDIVQKKWIYDHRLIAGRYRERIRAQATKVVSRIVSNY
jgi:glycosyltransferase involved in cell wall biosynthesis